MSYTCYEVGIPTELKARERLCSLLPQVMGSLFLTLEDVWENTRLRIRVTDKNKAYINLCYDLCAVSMDGATLFRGVVEGTPTGFGFRAVNYVKN